MIFNISTTDDDGNSTNKIITTEQAAEIKDILKKNGSDVKAFCTRMKINSVDEMPASIHNQSLMAIIKNSGKKSNEGN